MDYRDDKHCLHFAIETKAKEIKAIQDAYRYQAKIIHHSNL